MEQLTVNHILAFINLLKDQGMTIEEIRKLPIYLGNDDELNGIHCGWYTNLVDADNVKNEDDKYIVEMINEDHCNIKLNSKAILIS